MCYSAMVEQNAKKLARQFDADIKLQMYAEIFQRRLDGEKLLINKAMEQMFLKDAESMKEKAIAKDIRLWHEKEISRVEAEMQKQTERLERAQESLKKKETKKAQEDVRISTNKISKAKYDLEKHKTEDIKSEGDERIFPFSYASMLCLDENDKKIIMPVRYHMRPHNKPESFDYEFGGCYNARYDNLTKVEFWRDSLDQKRRGLMLVRKFYENVPVERYLENRKLPKELKDRENIVIRFEPEGYKEMYVPILWDEWQHKGSPILFSSAIITDEPPPEIQAAGHDRCPIFLSEDAIEEWLYSDLKGKDLKELVLVNRERPKYSHHVLTSAA